MEETDLTNDYDKWNVTAGPWAFKPFYDDPWFTRSSMFGVRAGAYLPQFFGCGGAFSNGYVCNPHLDRRMRKAQLLQVEDPSRAAAAWAKVDREITDNAYWVPTVTLRYQEVVSKRLHGYQFHPAWGFLADQAWVSRR